MNDFLSTFLQNLAMALIPLLVPVAVVWIVKEIQLIWSDFKARNAGLAYILEDGAKLAVAAAEQAGIAKIITDKKSYAIATLQAILDTHGYKNIDLGVIEAAIEAAVGNAAFPHSTPPATTPTPSS
jgi:hypothetical protein